MLGLLTTRQPAISSVGMTTDRIALNGHWAAGTRELQARQGHQGQPV